jgi:hypothetical protein
MQIVVVLNHLLLRPLILVSSLQRYQFVNMAFEKFTFTTICSKNLAKIKGTVEYPLKEAEPWCWVNV